MRRARTVEEYTDWVKQAHFEMSELRECLAYEWDEDQATLEARLPWLARLEAQIEGLYRSMVEGSYAFADEELPFMAVVRDYGRQIPFAPLLEAIDRTHREGLDPEVED